MTNNAIKILIELVYPRLLLDSQLKYQPIIYLSKILQKLGNGNTRAKFLQSMIIQNYY